MKNILPLILNANKGFRIGETAYLRYLRALDTLFFNDLTIYYSKIDCYWIGFGL